MTGLFSGCSSLITLPDISKWNTNNVKDIGYLFYKCSSLKSLPNISTWNTSNISFMNNVFCDCSLLNNLPNISIWDVSNVATMDYMFYGCSSLISISDLSNWKPISLLIFRDIFKDCSSLISLPDISNWGIYVNDNLKILMEIKKNKKNIFDSSKEALLKSLLDFRNEICNNDNFSLSSSSFHILMDELNNSYSDNLTNPNNSNLTFSIKNVSFNEINVYFFEKKDNNLEDYYDNFYN